MKKQLLILFLILNIGSINAQNIKANSELQDKEFVKGKKLLNEYKYGEAKQAFLTAAKKGNTEAMVRLGYLEKDKGKSYAWFLAAAEKNNIEAIRKLVWTLQEGNDIVPKNLDEAEKWLKRGVDLGDLRSIINLHRFYSSTKQSGFLAATWEKKAEEAKEQLKIQTIEAASTGDMEATMDLASSYRYGTYTEKNSDKALMWYKKAAEKGDVDAMKSIATLYEWDLKNYDKAMEWYLKAAERGEVNAMIGIATMYLYGRGVEENYTKFAEWKNKAEEILKARETMN